jgi:hypothetical protein
MITGHLISIQWIREFSELVLVHEVPVHVKVGVWRALSASCITDTLFLKTINLHWCVTSILTPIFFAHLSDYGRPCGLFQQDSAKAHAADNSVRCLESFSSGLCSPLRQIWTRAIDCFTWGHVIEWFGRKHPEYTLFNFSSRISTCYVFTTCLSHWPRGLRRRSSAARLQRFCVRIPPGAWVFVCCECCMLSGRGLCDGLITRPEESYRLCASLCVIKKPRKRGG